MNIILLSTYNVHITVARGFTDCAMAMCHVPVILFAACPACSFFRMLCFAFSSSFFALLLPVSLALPLWCCLLLFPISLLSISLFACLSVCLSVNVLDLEAIFCLLCICSLLSTHRVLRIVKNDSSPSSLTPFQITVCSFISHCMYLQVGRCIQYLSLASALLRLNSSGNLVNLAELTSSGY